MALSHSFRVIDHDHEIISVVILLFPLIQEWLLSVTSKKYVHKVLVNGLDKLAQEKVWFGELTVST